MILENFQNSDGENEITKLDQNIHPLLKHLEKPTEIVRLQVLLSKR